MTENWPFHDLQSGAKLEETRFYGFGDAGGLAGKFEGYNTLEEAIKDIIEDYDIDEVDIGTKQDDLGGYSVTVLTGRAFVDQLYVICDGDQEHFNEFGFWSGK